MLSQNIQASSAFLASFAFFDMQPFLPPRGRTRLADRRFAAVLPIPSERRPLALLKCSWLWQADAVKSEPK